ncbi:hypothetical protein ACWD0J_20740 [Streptomyces sp. NPDC003011]
MSDAELESLRAEVQVLRTFVSEFRIPLANTAGGYGEIVGRRQSLKLDQWQITDGANSNRKVWVAGDWRPIADLSMDAAHPYTLHQALQVAAQVAEYEGATLEALVNALENAYEYQCPECRNWSRWSAKEQANAGGKPDVFWCEICTTQTPLGLAPRRLIRGDQ